MTHRLLFCALLLCTSAAIARGWETPESHEPEILGCITPVLLFPAGTTVPTPATVARQSDSTMDALTVFPNPTSGRVTVELRLAALTDTEHNAMPVTLTVSSVLGERLLIREGEAQSNMYRTELDFEPYASGLYIITVEAEGRTWTRKVARE